jgi:hypothetical protein
MDRCSRFWSRLNGTSRSFSPGPRLSRPTFSGARFLSCHSRVRHSVANSRSSSSKAEFHTRRSRSGIVRLAPNACPNAPIASGERRRSRPRKRREAAGRPRHANVDIAGQQQLRAGRRGLLDARTNVRLRAHAPVRLRCVEAPLAEYRAQLHLPPAGLSALAFEFFA